MNTLNPGHTRFDEYWLKLADHLLTQKSDAHAVEVTMGSILDLCPTLPMQADRISEVMTGAIMACITDDTFTLADPNTPVSAASADGVFRLHMLPAKEGRISVVLDVSETSLMDLRGIALWCSQTVMTRLAYTHCRPGPARIFIRTLRVGNDEDQAKMMGLLIDWPATKLGDVMRRKRDSQVTNGYSMERPLIEEYDSALCTLKLQQRGYLVSAPERAVMFQHTLAHNAFVLMGGKANVHEDDALALLEASRIMPPKGKRK